MSESVTYKKPLKKLRNLFGLISVAAATALAGAFLLFTQIAAAQEAVGAQPFGWDITSFNSDIIVEKDGSVTVTETIVADYSREPHHGIFRYVPVKYRDRFGNNLSLRLTVLSVTDENSKNWPYEKSMEGNDVYLKIGNPDVYLDQLTTFRITYRMDRAVLFFKDHDEIYWNVTGVEWPVAMHKVNAKVTVPEGIAEKDIKATCYTGGFGSSEQNCNYVIGTRDINFEATSSNKKGLALQSYEGLTIVAGFPKGFVTPPTLWQQISWFLLDNWGYGLPVITFIYMYYIWYTRGRDPYTGRTAIMPIYKPPQGLTPTEIGTIIDETVDLRDISSAIIDLAVRGYLKIVETTEKQLLVFDASEYTFEKLKKFDDDTTLKPHEIKILQAIFGTGNTKKLSDLNNKFYKDLPGIKKQIYKQLISDGYFPGNPEKIRNKYYLIGGILLGAVFFGLSFLILFFSLSVILGLAGSGLIVLVFAKFMPAKTKKGVDTYYQIKGLEEYINTAEKDRIKFQEQQNIFETLLPFAMTLGLATKWSSAFEGIFKTPPAWFVSSDLMWYSHFSTSRLTSKLNSMSGTMQSAFASSPRSASGGGSGFSGGFSGGGFGGGGGGSW